MAQQAARIVSDDDVLGGEPRIEERPITARRIAELVEEGDADAETVADRYDLDVADVYRALAYYHDHPEEMAAVRRRRERLESDARADGVPTLDEPEALRAGADDPSVAALARRQERVLLTNDADFLDKRNTPNRPPVLSKQQVATVRNLPRAMFLTGTNRPD